MTYMPRDYGRLRPQRSGALDFPGVNAAISPKADLSPLLGVGGGDDLMTSMSLLNALGGIQQAGLTRTATPIGSIAQNLIPLFGAMIQAKAMENGVIVRALRECVAICPPLIIDEAQIDMLFDGVEKAFDDFERTMQTA